MHVDVGCWDTPPRARNANDCSSSGLTCEVTLVGLCACYGGTFPASWLKHGSCRTGQHVLPPRAFFCARAFQRRVADKRRTALVRAWVMIYKISLAVVLRWRWIQGSTMAPIQGGFKKRFLSSGLGIPVSVLLIVAPISLRAHSVHQSLPLNDVVLLRLCSRSEHRQQQQRDDKQCIATSSSPSNMQNVISLTLVKCTSFSTSFQSCYSLVFEAPV